LKWYQNFVKFFIRRYYLKYDLALFFSTNIKKNLEWFSQMRKSQFVLYVKLCISGPPIEMRVSINCCYQRCQWAGPGPDQVHFTKFFLFDKFDKKPDNKEIFYYFFSFFKFLLLSGFLSNLSKWKNLVKWPDSGHGPGPDRLTPLVVIHDELRRF
jgi:hypothetical protein